MGKVVRSSLLLLMMATLGGGCYFEVSSDSSNAGGTRTAEELAGLITVQFAMKANGVEADIVCATGLSGEAGRQGTCTGTTSDGYTLEIVTLDRGEGAFRWDVVKSVPVERGG